MLALYHLWYLLVYELSYGSSGSYMIPPMNLFKIKSYTNHSLNQLLLMPDLVAQLTAKGISVHLYSMFSISILLRLLITCTCVIPIIPAGSYVCDLWSVIANAKCAVSTQLEGFHKENTPIPALCCVPVGAGNNVKQKLLMAGPGLPPLIILILVLRAAPFGNPLVDSLYAWVNTHILKDMCCLVN